MFELFAGLCLISILKSLFVALRLRAAERLLSWTPCDVPAPSGKVSALVPARDEAADLAASLRSLLAQTGIDLEIVVVNDHSTDDTGPIADALARADPRVRVLHDPPVSPGWFGKLNALQAAAGVATGDFLLIADADVHHGPGVLRAALAEMNRDDLDLLSLFPTIECVSFWENTLVPIFEDSIALHATPALEDPRSPEALAIGAFTLVRATALHELGGFAPLKTEALDDVELARHFKKHGKRTRFRLAPKHVEVRLFKGNTHAFWGTQKNILAPLRGRLWLVPLLLLIPLLVFGAPVVSMLLGGWHSEPLLVLIGLATYLVQFGALWRGGSFLRYRPWKAAFFPLVVLPLSCCVLGALYHRLRHGTHLWRGRSVPLDTK